MSVRAGTRLDGRYRLAERLAVGGMGEVWSGIDEVLGRDVAVKVLRAELAEDDAFRRRFRAEARTAGGLPHTGIAAVFDYGETTVGPDGVSPSNQIVQGDGIAYLVMELVPGEPLSAVISREGAMVPERAAGLLAQTARALHAAHQRGVVHRDVKPANLMVTPEGRVKVTDFGIARPNDHEPLTMTGQVMGTAHYLAPELARGDDASPLSDVYALGVVFYECLAGRRPFDGDNQVLVATAHLSQTPPPLPDSVPAAATAIVAAAMEKSPERRAPSAEALAIALERFARHDPKALDGLRPNSGAGPHGAAPMITSGGAAVAPQPTDDHGWGGSAAAASGLAAGAAAAASSAAPTVASGFSSQSLDHQSPTTISSQADTSLFEAAQPASGYRANPPHGHGQHAIYPPNSSQYSTELPLPPPPAYQDDPDRRAFGVWAWVLGGLAAVLVLVSLVLLLRGGNNADTGVILPSGTATRSVGSSASTAASASTSTRPSGSSTTQAAAQSSASKTASTPASASSRTPTPTPSRSPSTTTTSAAPSPSTTPPTPSATPTPTPSPTEPEPTESVSASPSLETSVSPTAQASASSSG